MNTKEDIEDTTKVETVEDIISTESYEDKKAAINQGMLLADKFGIGVWDSTVANNGKWIA